MAEPTSAVLVDANLLLLLAAGTFDPTFIGRGRLDIFIEDDFHLLVAHLGRFRRNLTTPHVLAELSNLADQIVPRLRHRTFREFLAGFIRPLDERWTAAADLSISAEFTNFGLTDAGICHLADASVSVYTVDAPLYAALLGRGVDATNFHHLRRI